MNLSVLLTLVEGNVSGVVRHGDLVIIRAAGKAQSPKPADDRPGIRLIQTAGRLASGLQDLTRREEKKELLKLAGPEVLKFLEESNELEGIEVFVRVKAGGTRREGMFAYIIPPDATHKLELHRGKSKEEAVRKGRRSERVLSGALFAALDRETVAEIAQRE